MPYEITDEQGATSEATLSIEVVDVDAPIDINNPSTFNNAPPIATNDEFETFNTVPVSSSLVSNDSDPDSDPITLTEINGQSVVDGDVIDVFDPNDPTSVVGTLTIIDVTTGEFTFTPTDPTFSGEPTFCLLYTSPSPRDRQKSRMPSSA